MADFDLLALQKEAIEREKCARREQFAREIYEEVRKNYREQVKRHKRELNERKRKKALSAANAAHERNSPAERDQHLAEWRSDFNAFIWRYYESKARHYTVMSRSSVDYILDQLNRIASGRHPFEKPRHYARHYAIGWMRSREYNGTEGGTHGKVQVLLKQGTERVFIPVEDMFDVLHQFHANVVGRSKCRILVHNRGKVRFANIGMKIVQEFLRGYEFYLGRLNEDKAVSPPSKCV